MKDLTLILGGKFSYEEWHPDSRYYSKEFITPEDILDILPLLDEYVAIDEAATFGDLLLAIDVNGVDTLEIILGEKILPYLEEAKIHTPNKSDVKFLKIVRTGYWERNGHGLAFDLSGIGPSEEEGFTGDVSYSMSLTPVNEMLHLPIVLDETVRFWSNQIKSSVIWETRMRFTLRDVLKAIFDDISFYGIPGDRAELRHTPLGMAEDIMDGKVETYPLEDLESEEDDD